METDSCPFCAIVRGEREAHVIYADDNCVAFLDRRPLFPGHILLIPRGHVATLPELPPESVGPLFAVARLLAAAVERGMGSQGSFVALNNRVSQSVPHLHVHVVPRTKGDGLKGFFWPRQKYASDEEMALTAERLRQAVDELRKEE